MDISQQLLIPMTDLRAKYPDFDTSKALFRVSPDVYSAIVDAPEHRLAYVPLHTWSHEIPLPCSVWGVDLEADSTLTGTSCEFVYLLHGQQVYPFDIELGITDA